MSITADRTVRINFVGEDKNVGDVVSGVKGQMVALAAVVAATTKAVSIFNDETARMDDTAKAFDKSGLSSIETYQKLEQVAKLGGTEIGRLTKATVRLNRNLFAISQGSGKAANDALQAIGLSAEDLAGKDETEQLGVLAGALNRVEDNGRRAALAEELLGRSGRDLLPVLKAGSAGLDEMVGAVERTFTREDLAKAEAYQDSLANLEKAANDAKTEFVVGLAPVMTEIADEIRLSGQEIGSLVPLISKAAQRIAVALEQPLAIAGFFADQLGTLGRVADLIGGKLGRARDAVSGLASEAAVMVGESEIAGWAREAAAEIVDMTGVADGLTDGVREQVPFVDELAMSWDEVARAISGADVAASEMSAIGRARDAIGSVLDLGKSFEKQQQAAEELGQARVQTLLDEAATAEFVSSRTRAEGGAQEHINATMLEGLRLRAQAAQLQADLTQSTDDQRKALEAQRKLEVAEAGATVKKRGGGRRVSEAQRLLAAGEQRIAQLEHEANLGSVLARDAKAQAAADRAAYEAARARLELERQALEVKRARGSFARQELANEQAAVAFEIEALDVERRVAARTAERNALAEVASIEQARSLSEAQAAARRMELLGNEFAAREILRQQQEQSLLANPPEDELSRIERMDTLKQLAFDREMDQRQRSQDAATAQAELEERLHEAELKRIEEKKRKQKAAIDATGRFLSTGQQLASAVIGAAIKDEEKRANAELKARGVMAIATGALETVRAAASFASFNFVEGALHTAAAALAFTQGGIMLSGNIPGRGSAGAGPGAAAVSPRADRETEEAARTVESLPAADREPPRQPTPGQGGGGNVITIERIDVTGAIDDDTVEKIRLGLDNVNNGLEAAG